MEEEDVLHSGHRWDCYFTVKSLQLTWLSDPRMRRAYLTALTHWCQKNGRLFADNIFKCILLNENVWIPNKISLKFVPKGPINNNPSLVQIMAWRLPGDKPLSEPMMVSSLTHICFTRPQWVKVHQDSRQTTCLIIIKENTPTQMLLPCVMKEIWQSYHTARTYMSCMFSVYPISSWWLREYIALSYYHHQIGSMNYHPLFRVRSWNNGMRCMSLYILIGYNTIK